MIDEEILEARLRKLEETVEAHARRIGEVDHKASEFSRNEKQQGLAVIIIVIVIVMISGVLLVAERYNLF